MKTILISRGKHKSKVSDCDYKIISVHKWHLSKQPFQKTSYAKTKINGKYVMMHRMIMKARNGQIVDHINRDGLDNQRENLRFVTKSQNRMNTDKTKPDISSSKYKGVTYIKNSKKHWRSSIVKGGRRVTIGCFESEEDAARAYDKMAKQLHGEYCYTNFKS